MTERNYTNDFDQVSNIVTAYFDGLHHGNIEKLNAIFHADAFLKSPGKRYSLKQWFDDVASRDVPAEIGQVYNYKILSIDVVKDQAMVKLVCPLYDYNYIDFLGLLKEGGRWSIVNKMYTDVGDTL